MGPTKKEKSPAKKTGSVEKDSKKKKEKKDKKQKQDKDADSKPIEQEEKAEPKEEPKIEETNDDNAQDDDTTVIKKSKKRKVRKSPEERQAKKKAAASSPAKSSDPIKYLRLFQSDRSAWKFNKMHQTWLLKHIYDVDQIEEDDFEILVEYLKGLQGGARDRALKEAQGKIPAKATDYDQEIFDAEAALAFVSAPAPPAEASDDDDDENDTPEIKRARAIVRALA